MSFNKYSELEDVTGNDPTLIHFSLNDLKTIEEYVDKLERIKESPAYIQADEKLVNTIEYFITYISERVIPLFDNALTTKTMLEDKLLNLESTLQENSPEIDAFLSDLAKALPEWEAAFLKPSEELQQEEL